MFRHATALGPSVRITNPCALPPISRCSSCARLRTAKAISTVTSRAQPADALNAITCTGRSYRPSRMLLTVLASLPPLRQFRSKRGRTCCRSRQVLCEQFGWQQAPAAASSKTYAETHLCTINDSMHHRKLAFRPQSKKALPKAERESWTQFWTRLTTVSMYRLAVKGGMRLHRSQFCWSGYRFTTPAACLPVVRRLPFILIAAPGLPPVELHRAALLGLLPG